MKSIAVIPARGGSKRIPRKNIKEFCGKPIIAYSIEAAKQSGVFDVVMVSTDDEEIAEVAREYGAEVPFLRSSETANDYATTVDVMLEVIDEYRKIGQEFDVLCCLYPCAPFVSASSLQEGMNVFTENDADSVMNVCKFPVPVEWAIDISSGEIKFNDVEATFIRSQDLTPKYYDAGQFYFVKVSSMIAEKTVNAGRALPVVISEKEVQDIDSAEDWKIAEIKFRMLKGL